MQLGKMQDFLCPHCAGVNTLTVNQADCMKEQSVCCEHCRQIVNITPATGLDDAVNLVISERAEEIASR